MKMAERVGLASKGGGAQLLLSGRNSRLTYTYPLIQQFHLGCIHRRKIGLRLPKDMHQDVHGSFMDGSITGYVAAMFSIV